MDDYDDPDTSFPTKEDETFRATLMTIVVLGGSIVFGIIYILANT